MGVRRDLAAWYAGAAYTASAAVCCVAAARSQANFVDLHVYRMGGAAVLHGGDLYRLRFAWLSFTYPASGSPAGRRRPIRNGEALVTEPHLSSTRRTGPVRPTT